jgi:putative ATP-dependent endonuclease of the OLD family
VALRELFVERFRGVRSARIGFDPTTVLFGENDCGKSSLLEALALVLSPLAEARPRLEPWHFHRAGGSAAAPQPAATRIQLTFGESRAGSWDRPELAALSPVLGRSRGKPRTLVVEVTARPAAPDTAVDASFEIRSPDGGPGSLDDASALAAVRRMNPLVWLRHGVLVKSPDGEPRDKPSGPRDTLPDAAEVLRRYGRFLAGTTASEEQEVESGHEAAERLLAEWAPAASARNPGTRAAVAEILGRGRASSSSCARDRRPECARSS